MRSPGLALGESVHLRALAAPLLSSLLTYKLWMKAKSRACGSGGGGGGRT